MVQRYSHLTAAALTDTIALLEPAAGRRQDGDILETADGRESNVSG